MCMCLKVSIYCWGRARPNSAHTTVIYVEVLEGTVQGQIQQLQ